MTNIYTDNSVVIANMQKTIDELRQQLAQQPSATLRELANQRLKDDLSFSMQMQLSNALSSVDVLVEALTFYADKRHMDINGCENGRIARKTLTDINAR